MDTLRIWKRIGETPLQALHRARLEYNIDPVKKACYTGRLDPMAQGAMTLLFGDQVHRSMEHNSSQKIYQFQAVLGASTSSYDPLGRITNVRQVTATEARQFKDKMLELPRVGEFQQPLPPYSAYRHRGEPLWKHANAGTLPPLLPTKLVEVFSIKALQPHPTMISLDQYRNEVMDDIDDLQSLSPNAQFKIPDIRSDWMDLRVSQLRNFYRVAFETDVRSGTFIRSLVYDTAQSIGIPAHAFRITRTHVPS